MKILHITPHLGGGVGKAHAAIAKALPSDWPQTFVLLEAPRDRRYVELIARIGGHIVTATDLREIAVSVRDADIVQFEFWNHPRLFECLAHCDFPAMRSVFWSHISGLFKPVIQPELIVEAGRFVFSSTASLDIPSLATLPDAARRKISVINSGFGFEGLRRRMSRRGGKPAIAYLGTVDFVKLHPGFFDAVDRLEGEDIRVAIWGHVDPQGAVAARARAMHHPSRISFGGHTGDPAGALAAADIFFYPLRRHHYGTSENALIEAMSLGLTPVVLDNPAETSIIHHGKTGFVGKSIEDCAAILQMLLSSPEILAEIGANTMRDVAETRNPARSVENFVALWRELEREPKRLHDFRRIIGAEPADWFLATQCLPGERWTPSDFGEAEGPMSKGSLAHFANAFPDSGLAALLGDARAAN